MGKAKPKDSALYHRYLETYIAASVEDDTVAAVAPTDLREAAAAALAVYDGKQGERPRSLVEIEADVKDMLEESSDA